MVANYCIHSHRNTQGVAGVPGRNGTDGQKVSIHSAKQNVQYTVTLICSVH